MNTSEIKDIPTEVLIKKRYRQERMGMAAGFVIPLGIWLLCFLYPHRFVSWGRMQSILILISTIALVIVGLVTFKIRRQLKRCIGGVVDMELEKIISRLKEMNDETVWNFYLAEGLWVGVSGFVVSIILSIGFSMIFETLFRFFSK